jgi:hypothetical protein
MLVEGKPPDVNLFYFLVSNCFLPHLISSWSVSNELGGRILQASNSIDFYHTQITTLSKPNKIGCRYLTAGNRILHADIYIL